LVLLALACRAFPALACFSREIFGGVFPRVAKRWNSADFASTAFFYRAHGCAARFARRAHVGQHAPDSRCRIRSTNIEFKKKTGGF